MPRPIYICLFAAVGCSHQTLLGISSEREAEQPASANLTSAPAPVAQALGRDTIISGNEEEHPWMRRPSLGDVDGDGLDDFLVEASWEDASANYGNRAFLFYGKPEFPAQLSTADADAVFETGELPGTKLGDINGDGFADFALGDWNGFEIIFGSSARFTGSQARFASGLTWMASAPGESPFYLRAAGDVDGDGAAEFRVTVISDVPAEEASNRGSEVVTDYLIAGRRDAWPSGTWDPAWAVAQLADEPPAFENDGLTTVLQRLNIVSASDLDGDGYADLLALGRWRMWVFYGSERGFHGMLTTEQADASIVWPYDATQRRPEFSKTLPFILGDVDGDGTAELAIPQQAELGIVYGTKRRWSGRVQLEPDLTIVRASSELADRNWWLPLAEDLTYGAPFPEGGVSTEIRVGVTDLDGDAQREIVLHETRYPPLLESNNGQVVSVTYTLTGANKRATGRYVLGDADVLRAASVSGTGGMLLDPGGDFDGDGSTDLIFGVSEDVSVSDSKLSLHLVPGTPRAPD
jgi:hypothetical protein